VDILWTRGVNFRDVLQTMDGPFYACIVLFIVIVIYDLPTGSTIN